MLPHIDDLKVDDGCRRGWRPRNSPGAEMGGAARRGRLPRPTR